MNEIRLKTPVTYYGGKQRMLKHILPLIPPHNLYNEPFVGGAAVYFAKEPANVEVVNDTNDALITFYRIMKEKPEELIKKIKPHFIAASYTRSHGVCIVAPNNTRM